MGEQHRQLPANTPAGTPAATPPAGRYGPGPRPRRRARGLALGALFAVFVAAVAVFAYQHVAVGVDSSVIGYQVGADGRSVNVLISVRKPKDRTATCVVQATDRDHNQVGRVEVRIGAGQETVERTVSLRTTAKPDNGLLGDCSLD